MAPAPVAEPVALPAPSPSAPARKKAKVVPVDRRPWRVLIVSASPGAAPRSFEVSRWQARLAVTGLALAALLATGVVAAVVVAVRAPDLFVDGTEVTALRAELASARDSLAAARAELEAPDESGDSTVAAPAGATAPAPAAVTPAKVAPAHPRPLSARPARRPAVESEGVLSSMPRSLADLPVIGIIASGFSRARRHPLLHLTRPHLGVDVAAPRGTRVSAPAPGRVRFVGRKIGFGLVVELDHGEGVTTRYAHLRSSAVEVGEQVTKGEAIAAVGTSGITTGPHLHYEVLVHGHQVDPLRYRFPGSAPDPVAAPAVIASPVAPTPSGSAVGTHDAPPVIAPAP